MITAIALVQAVTGQITEIGEALADVQGVTEVYSLSRKDVDLIAIVRVVEPRQLAELTNQLSEIRSVLNIDTHIAFRHYSNRDIQAGFSIGFKNHA